MNWKHALIGLGLGLAAIWLSNNVAAVGNVVGKK